MTLQLFLSAAILGLQNLCLAQVSTLSEDLSSKVHTTYMVGAESSNFNLRVMNYNIKGLPWFANGNSEENLAKIISTIKSQVKQGLAPDVILFQEVFTDQALAYTKKLYSKELYPYMALGPADGSGYLYSSGLVALSRYPIYHLESIRYGNQCAGWDCYSNKGAQLIEIKGEGWIEPILIVNTHMQATNEHDSVRFEQIKMLKDFLKPYEEKGLNIIMGGDFNTKPNRKSYEFFKSHFNSFKNVGEFCSKQPSFCRISSRTAAEHVLEATKDHQFFSCSSKASIIPVQFVRNFSKEVDNLELSDHKAYQVDYAVEWNSKKCAALFAK